MEPITDQTAFAHLATIPRALLLKHGAHCPISANARDEVSRFATDHPHVPVYSLEVTEHRDLSRDVAFALGVRHESPQLFLLCEGKASWHAEHYDISADAIRERLAAG